MGFADEFGRELDTVLGKRDDAVLAGALELHFAIIAGTPVDTSWLKQSWVFSSEGNIHATETNVEYGPVIDGGRRQVDGKWQGSEQLPDGYKPIIEREHEAIQKALEAIK